MSHMALHVPDLPPSVALVPGPIELLGCPAKLHDEIAGEILGLGLTPFLVPEANQGGFIVAHDDSGVGAADKTPSSHWSGTLTQFHDSLFYVLYVILCISNNIP